LPWSQPGFKSPPAHSSDEQTGEHRERQRGLLSVNGKRWGANRIPNP
jgi:hypothetical protein